MQLRWLDGSFPPLPATFSEMIQTCSQVRCPLSSTSTQACARGELEVDPDGCCKSGPGSVCWRLFLEGGGLVFSPRDGTAQVFHMRRSFYAGLPPLPPLVDYYHYYYYRFPELSERVNPTYCTSQSTEPMRLYPPTPAVLCSAGGCCKRGAELLLPWSGGTVSHIVRSP